LFEATQGQRIWLSYDEAFWKKSRNQLTSVQDAGKIQWLMAEIDG
jgi:hypothetical protein